MRTAPLGAGGAVGAHPVVDLLERVEAVPGRCHTLPSGIVHALGAGVLVAEVQTPSDTTYRLHDWGRAGRALHIEAGLASAFGPGGIPTVVHAPSAGPLADGEMCARLADTAYYTVDEVRLLDGDEVTIGFPCRCAGKHASESPLPHECGFVLMTIAGNGELGAAGMAGSEGPGFAPVALAPGKTVYVPPACAREATLRGRAGLRVLRIGVLASPTAR